MRVSRFAKHTSQTVREEQGGCARPCRLYMEVIQIMRAGLDPGTEGGRKKPGRIIKRELSSEERAHTGRTHTGTHGQSRGALMQLGARRAVDSLFFARVLLRSCFCLFGCFFKIINHIIFHFGAESVATVCLFRTSRIFGISFRIKVDTWHRTGTVKFEAELISVLGFCPKPVANG